MNHTLAGLPPTTLAELSQVWPEYSWDRGTLRHGAFHVVVMVDDAVFRLRTGRNRRTSIDAEVNAMRTLSTSGLGITSPRVFEGAFHAERWSAFDTTLLPGSPLKTTSWAGDRAVILPILECLRSVELQSGVDVPPTRQWCGGPDFAGLVEETTAALTPQVRAAARDAVTTMLRQERDDQTFSHGDFGPHNILVNEARSSLIDPDNLCLGDEAIDVAPLLGFYSAPDLKRDFPAALVKRAAHVKTTLPLQVAVAAELAGDEGLRDHALNNFATRQGFRSPHWT